MRKERGGGKGKQTFPSNREIWSLNIQNWKKVKSLSRVGLFVTPWTIAHQAPLSMGFSKQEYWSGLPFPFPGDLPDPGIKPTSGMLQADLLPLSQLEASWLSANLKKKYV